MARWHGCLPARGPLRVLAVLGLLLLAVVIAIQLRLAQLLVPEPVPPAAAAPRPGRHHGVAEVDEVALSCIERSEGGQGAPPMLVGNGTAPRFAELRRMGCPNYREALLQRHRRLPRPACERLCAEHLLCGAFAIPFGGKMRGDCLLFTGQCFATPSESGDRLYLRFDSPIEGCLGRERADALGGTGILRAYAAWEERVQRRSRFVDGMDGNLWVAYFSARESGELLRLAPQHVKLHPYWSLLGMADDEMGLVELFIARTLRMRQQLPRDDLLVEKSKCVMNGYFRRSGLPHPEVVRMWEDPASFLREVPSLPKDTFPAMIKFCHLTQGTQGMRNTRFVASLDELRLHAQELQDWVLQAWNCTPRDNAQPWSNFGINTMLRGLSRGVFLQRAWPTFEGFNAPVELKINCVWGRCVLGRLEGHGPPSDVEFTFREGRIERFDGHGQPVGGTGEIFGEGGILSGLPHATRHIRAAFRLAERDAQNLEADFIRVDVFLNPSDPEHPSINEHSIYEMSGMLGVFASPLADLWLSGYATGRARPRHKGAHIPVYKLGR